MGPLDLCQDSKEVCLKVAVVVLRATLLTGDASRVEAAATLTSRGSDDTHDDGHAELVWNCVYLL